VSAYAEAVAYLQGLEVARGWDLSLERMRTVLALRGHPERSLAAIHVAGTNGKGSTAAMLEACLRAGGWRTGLYTSPHLVDFAERIRAGGRMIPQAVVVEAVGALRAALAGAGLVLTHFEFVTVLAFEWFARIGVEVAVIEVGLGGRLDATNVVEPVCSVVTPIGLDHESFLGTTLEEIAAEKAGIVKAGVPVCMGRLVPAAAAPVAARAAALGAPLRRAGHDGVLERAGAGFTFRAPGVAWADLHLGLRGAFQRDNAELALLALATVQDRWPLSPAAVRTGLAAVVWPGRLAVLRQRPLVVLDGAHNPAAIDALAGELPALLGGRPTTLVFAAMQDKAWNAEIDRLLPHVAEVVVTRVGRRAEDPHRLAAAVAGRRPVTVTDDPRQALHLAIERAGAGGAVLVTGSLFLVGEGYTALGETPFETWHGWEGDGTEPRR
jgi:dihydrofolate synthase/folylpolyglutamate synthase